MALEDVLNLGEGVINNTNSSLIEVLPPEITSGIGTLITILKITGIVVIAYIVFLIIKWILSMRRNRRISKMYKRVEEINRKLDILLAKHKSMPVKKPQVKVVKKIGFFKRLFGSKKPKKIEKVKKFKGIKGIKKVRKK